MARVSISASPTRCTYQDRASSSSFGSRVTGPTFRQRDLYADNTSVLSSFDGTLSAAHSDEYGYEISDWDTTSIVQRGSVSPAERLQLSTDDIVSQPEDVPTHSPRAEKIIKLFGDVPSHILNKIQAKTLPWYLRPNHSDTEILNDPDGKISGGTLYALIEHLTSHEQPASPGYTKTFLLTFKSFTDVETLFELLVQRFWIQPPDGLAPQELNDWETRKQDLIRTRVLNTFKTMIQDEDVLEKDDLYILDKMKEFLLHHEVSHMAAAKHVLLHIDRVRSGGDGARPRRVTISLDPAPPPIIPRFQLLDFDPLECARQLTIIECALFMRIKASECLSYSWEGKFNADITAAIEMTSKLANWVGDAILEEDSLGKRALIIAHFITVADHCRDIKNFSSMIAIVSGLNSPAIRRLKRAWDQISKRYVLMLGTCETIIDSDKNFDNYRQLLQRIMPPCVPFLGVYLTTLAFIQDGAPNNLPGNLVNFCKRVEAAEVIQELQKWQSKPFNFQRVESIYDYIQGQLNKLNGTHDVSDVLCRRIVERELKAADSKARLLRETGFL